MQVFVEKKRGLIIAGSIRYFVFILNVLNQNKFVAA